MFEPQLSPSSGAAAADPLAVAVEELTAASRTITEPWARLEVVRRAAHLLAEAHSPEHLALAYRGLLAGIARLSRFDAGDAFWCALQRLDRLLKP
jgi:hypothetical protein